MKSSMKFALRMTLPTLVFVFGVTARAAVVAGEAEPTPAERAIKLAQAAVEKNAKNYRAYNALAMAMARRARETLDPVWYERAVAAIEKGFALVKSNYEGRRVLAWVRLGQHRFEEGRDLARTLHREARDDLMVYGMLVDANVELGDYEEAEVNGQWMLDMRPGNVGALTRGAYLRELFGDVDGALDFFRRAYRNVLDRETEDRAWILTHMARLERRRGKVEAAEHLLKRALVLFPNYPYALKEMGWTQMAAKETDEGLATLAKFCDVAPHPENHYEVGRALHLAGKTDAAKKRFERFEREARGEMDGVDNANVELIFYYVDHGNRAKEALRISTHEMKRRHDVRTLHAHAWALHANGRHGEARSHIERALAVGIRDAVMLCHAGRVVAACGDGEKAASYFLESMMANPRSDVVEDARRRLVAK